MEVSAEMPPFFYKLDNFVNDVDYETFTVNVC